MLDPRALTHIQLATIVADVQAILWQESRLLPDFPREYGAYWNPAKEWEAETVEEIADVLDAADLKPPDFMAVDLAAELAAAPSSTTRGSAGPVANSFRAPRPRRRNCTLHSYTLLMRSSPGASHRLRRPAP